MGGEGEGMAQLSAEKGGPARASFCARSQLRDQISPNGFRDVATFWKSHFGNRHSGNLALCSATFWKLPLISHRVAVTFWKSLLIGLRVGVTFWKSPLISPARRPRNCDILEISSMSSRLSVRRFGKSALQLCAA